jgi:hypothetical protein
MAAEQHLDRIRDGVFAEWREAVETTAWPVFGEFDEE